MSLLGIFDIAGSALTAQSVRLNTVASNLANAGTVAGSEREAYRARVPLFQALLDPFRPQGPAQGVRVAGVLQSPDPVPRRYWPDHPLADADGYVYLANVNPVEAMADMIAASRAYQNNVEVLKTSRQLLLQTLRLGQ